MAAFTVDNLNFPSQLQSGQLLTGLHHCCTRLKLVKSLNTRRMTNLKEKRSTEKQFNGVPAVGRDGHAHRGSVSRSNASQRPVLRAIGEDPVQI